MSLVNIIGAEREVLPHSTLLLVTLWGYEVAHPTPPVERLHDLGAIDAETDFRPDFFIPSSSWSRVRERERPIVVGRKGTGKTALRKALLNESTSNPLLFATDLAFRDYPWNAHNEVFDSAVGATSRFLETWHFLMLIELVKQAVGENQAPPRDREAADALGDFVRTNWGSLAFDYKDTFRTESYHVTGRFEPSLLGTKLGGAEWSRVERNRLGDSLSAMNKWLREALVRTLLPDGEYFLVFDELDLDFSPANEPYHGSIVGLLLAAQQLYLWSQEKGTRVTPVVLLRDDIYNRLTFPDKNKLTTNLVETLQWTPAFDGPDSLKTMADTRIRVLLETTAADPWAEVFEEQEMRGTQHKYSHMVQRTYLRPRDLIQFVNLCLVEARSRRQPAPDSPGRVTNDDVTRARTPYSKYLRNELADEISAHYPQWEQWTELLRRIGLTTFRRPAFADACQKASKLAAGAEPTEILEALYGFGIIGFGRIGGGGLGGTDEYWRYRDPNVAFDPEAPYFKVHPGLKEHLDLKEPRV
jgi:hypothetical protein